MKKTITIVVKSKDKYYHIPIKAENIFKAIEFINKEYIDNIVSIEVEEIGEITINT